jgi:hypothetical protein
MSDIKLIPNGNCALEARANVIAAKEKKMSNSYSKGTALITGASRGIGAVYAHGEGPRVRLE